jgi:ABC-type glutathione transport system ATPase component
MLALITSGVRLPFPVVRRGVSELLSETSSLETTGRVGEDVILSLRDVTVRFDMERGQSRVLDNVSMDVYREEILGIVGESGSGKSMFASVLLDAVVAPGQVEGDITYYPRDSDPVDILNLTK